MKPKAFIETVLVNEIKDVVERHPYLSFLLISVGIEFLGKCMMTDKQKWNEIKAEKAFKLGMELIYAVNPEYKKLNLKSELRDGFAHTFLPKSKIALSQASHGIKNFQRNLQLQTVLVAETFYEDFASACKTVIQTNFPENDKMNKDFIYIGP